MKHLKLFENPKQYESYKNGSNYVLPNVSYVKETKDVKYERKKAYILRAKYEATPDNLVAFTGASNVNAMSVNGTPIEIEPIKNEIIAFDVLGENISMNMETGEATFPESYLIKSHVSSWSFKAKDPNYTINENTFVCMLKMQDGMTMVQPAPSVDVIGAILTTNDGVTLELTDEFLDIINEDIQYGCQTGFALADMDVNNETFTFIDTEHQANVTTGGISTYSFDNEGLYDVKIELADSDVKDIRFNGSSLINIEISDAITSIGDYMFQYCVGLESVTIGNSVTTIGVGAFYSCNSLTSVTIGNSVTIIGNQAFDYCTSLKYVYCKPTTPPALGGTYVFDNNGSDRKIYVPAESVKAYKSATNWSKYASAIVGYDFENGEIVEVRLNNEIWYTSSNGKVVTPYKTNVFGAKIISNTYDNGKGVIIFDGDVTTIGQEAFYNCRSLTSVTIPDSVTTIGEAAFQYCTSLREFTGKFAEDNGRILVVDGVLTAFAPADITEYNIPESVTTIGEKAFFDCTSLTSINIPNSVTTIGDSAFVSCAELTSVTIGNGVTTIGKEAFFDCTSLTSVTIGDSVTEISSFAFYNCTRLTEVNIPDSVTTIGEQVFYNCRSLTSVTIPDSVTTIGEDAFADCYSLISVYCKATTPPGTAAAFSNNSSGRKIYVPAESVDAYKSAGGWGNYASAIEGYNFS